MIGRWITRLNQYHFKTVHRPYTQHRNAVRLSKRINDYVHSDKVDETLPEVSKGFNFPQRRLTNMDGSYATTRSFHQKLESSSPCCTFYRKNLNGDQSWTKMVTLPNGAHKQNWKRLQQLMKMTAITVFLV